MNFWANAYYKKKAFLYLLIPFSSLYRTIIAIRYFCYQKRIFKSKKFLVPIIIVGNITAGGTGKTPLVIWLANFLKKQGYRPGIVSRGYGGKNNKIPTQVFAQSDPQQVGDEPIVIAQRSQCPMVIGRKRVAAVEYLLSQHDCNVIIADDGMQHYALERDIEIAVIDGYNKFGNGFCLPVGPLREPIKRLKEVDFVVANSKQLEHTYLMQMKSQALINLVTHEKILLGKSRGEHNLSRVHAIAGIGNPDRFFLQLKQLGFELIPHPFPDHHFFKITDFNFKDDLPIIMTEKDAVKCRAFADKRFWYLSIEAQMEQSFENALLRKLELG